MIVGIDLGTTNSLIAIFEDEGPILVPNGAGTFLTPSVVGVDKKGNVLVGAAAKERLVTHPKETVALFKRQMGADKAVKLNGNTYRPEDLSALVLRALVADVEREYGVRPDEAVISVPAYFNDAQRKATKAAAEMAGLVPRRLINEPTAAALAHGLREKSDESQFIVIDLGGGTFDVSVLEMFEGVMEVRASAGDAFLGGEDYTDAVLSYLGKSLDIALKDITAQELSYLRERADMLKQALSTEDKAGIGIVWRETEHRITLDRISFEEMTTSITEKLKRPIQRALSDSSLRAAEIDRVILVGGATRMPLVRQAITRMFGRFPEHDIDPDHVVALGAAVQAGLVTRHEALEDIVMTDVCPFTLGVNTSTQVGPNEYIHDIFSPIIERNTVVPVSRVSNFSTISKGQSQVLFQIYQGESAKASENMKLGQLSIPVPVNKKDHEFVDCRFTYDSSGILEVIGTASSTGQSQTLVIEGNPGVLSKEEIAERLKKLDSLKIHPRDDSENIRVLTRLHKLYENSLGERRAWISHKKIEFEATLNRQDPRDIAAARTELNQMLDEIEALDVF